MHSTNSYEARRLDAMAESWLFAIKGCGGGFGHRVWHHTKLQPGQSTDGAVFYSNNGKPLGASTAAGESCGGVVLVPCGKPIRTSRIDVTNGR